MLAIGCLAAAIGTLASLPFLLRIRAVFNDSMLTVALFSILWIIQLLSSLAIPLGVTTTHTQSTNVCASTNPAMATYTVISPIMSLVRDTCVFVAISAKLMPHRQETGATMSRKKYLVSFFSGRDKEPISRAVLRTGQLYYLYVLMLKYYTIVSDTLFLTRCTVGGTIACVICRFIPTISLSRRIALMAPNLVFQNVMACRAFRSLKVNRTYNGTGTTSPSIILPSIRFGHSIRDADAVR